MSGNRIFIILLCLTITFSCSEIFAADVPEKDIAELTQSPKEPQTNDIQARKNYLIKFMEEKISESQSLLKKYPDAGNISKVREVLMMASFTLSRVKKNSADEMKIATEQAEALLKDKNSSAQSKLSANYVKYFLKMEKAPSDKIAGLISQCFDDIAKSDEKMAYRISIDLSVAGGDKALARKYLKKALNKYPDEEVFRLYEQKLMGYVGKTFSAELTTLDGKKVKLPKDYLGKVLVIDFWASWCGPCRAYAPQLKKIYAKYKDKGVVFIGISLDNNRTQLDDYLKKHEYPWIQTYSGGGWQDPTAVKYRVRGIPSIWVVGKDGKVITNDAAGNLDRILGEATE